jgi:parallel beta-helix repeat protein
LAHQIQSLSPALRLPLRFALRLALRLPLRFALRFALFAGVALCAQLACPSWAGVIYVKADAAGANNGHSWADAYTDLQAALAAAVWYDEIWVARGTYKPTSGPFVLKTRVGLYGGFAGAETERGQRDWKANATILSGTTKAHLVVIGADLTVLDGFTITGGTGSINEGGGMYNYSSSPTVTNCTFSGNSAGRGGGMCNIGGSPTVTNCTFTSNTVVRSGLLGRGGGMYNEGGSPTVTNCTFSANTASEIGGNGGGMYNDGSSPTVTNCTFSGNTHRGMYNEGGSPTVTNCTFSGNTGGGMSGGSPTVTNCTFSGNSAGGGGGMNTSGSPTVTNCTFIGNTADGDGGGMRNGGSPTVTNCTFIGNTASSGGGMDNNSGGSPTVTNCTFSGNAASKSGGGMDNTSSSPDVTNCIFWDNTAPVGAEVYYNEIYNVSGTPTFSHCDIRGSGGSGALWNPALGADGGGNIMAEPRFVAPATPAGPDGLWRTNDDGLRLQSNSPCIGAADPAVAPKTDILGLPRGTAPDMGAYEYFLMPPASADPAWLLFR